MIVFSKHFFKNFVGLIFSGIFNNLIQAHDIVKKNCKNQAKNKTTKET